MNTGCESTVVDRGVISNLQEQEQEQEEEQEQEQEQEQDILNIRRGGIGS